MTQSIPPVSATGTSVVTQTEENSQSLWDRIIGFIFADEQCEEPVAQLKEKKIMEIDPDVLRQKRLVEAEVAARRENEKRLAAERAAEKPASVEKVVAKPAPAAAPSPKPVEKVKPAPQPLPGVAVDEGMRRLAKSRFERLSSRLSVVTERLASLKSKQTNYSQQLNSLKGESEKAASALESLRRGPRHAKKRKELTESIDKIEKQMASLGDQLAASIKSHSKAKNELVKINSAVDLAQKVVDLVKGARVMPEELQKLEKAAEAAELSLTKA